MNHFASRCREPIAEHHDARLGNGRRIGHVPAKWCPLAPHIFELLEAGDALRRHRLHGTGGDEIAADALRAQVFGQIAADALERALGDTHPVVRRPGDGVVEVEPDERAAVGHQWHKRFRERLQRIGADVQRDRYVFPLWCHEIVAETRLWCEANTVQHAVDATPLLLQRLAHAHQVRRLRDIKLEHVGRLRQLAASALGQAQRTASTGKHDLGAFLLREHRDSVCKRGIGEDARDHDVLTVEKTHVASVTGLPPSD